MGLDIYIGVAAKERFKVDDKLVLIVPATVHSGPPITVIKEYRKHYNLHQWMVRVFEQRGCAGKFNDIPILLPLNDLVTLEAGIASGALYELCDFGKDQSWYVAHYRTEDAKSEDLQVVRRCLKEAAAGNGVFYEANY